MAKTKLYLTVFLIGTVVLGAGMWFYQIQTDLNLLEILAFGGIGLVVVFTTYVAVQRLKNERQGLPGEDELTVKVNEKAASRSFMGAIYLWTILYAFAFDSGISANILLGIGIMGMVLMFAGFWIYYNQTGIDHG